MRGLIVLISGWLIHFGLVLSPRPVFETVRVFDAKQDGYALLRPVQSDLADGWPGFGAVTLKISLTFAVCSSSGGS